MTWRNVYSERSGAVSHSRLLALGAFLVSSFVIIAMELRSATSSELVIGYLGIMVAGEVTKKLKGEKNEP